MDSIEIYQVDAFTDKMFHGNPASICILDDWLNDELLKAIAVENNLSETAFVIETKQGYQIRWFTLKGEINLCGHSTLAAGFLLFELGRSQKESVSFESMSGSLTVRKKGKRLIMELPLLPVHPVADTTHFAGLINKPVLGIFESDLDYLIWLEHEHQVLQAQVDLNMLGKLSKRGLILTAKSADSDFYSRCFYPKYNISEDPVTGSAYCVLAPFWSKHLNKNVLHGIQGSFRKGDVYCDVLDQIVHVSGYCKWYSKGRLMI